MRFLTLAGILWMILPADAQTPASTLWTELKAKRDQLAGLHQEFDVSQTYKTANSSQSSKRQIVLDASQGMWREKSVTGSGNQIHIFDGKDLFRMEEDGSEYVLTKRRPKDEPPAPSPYAIGDPDWSKAVELERRPCGIAGSDHTCVLLEGPLKPGGRTLSPTNLTRMVEGSFRMLLDTETGVLLSRLTNQLIESQKGNYRSQVSYMVKRLSYGALMDPKLFTLPSSGMSEVRALAAWNAAKIKKELAGKPAPGLAVTDIQGKPLELSAFKGKTVLLDFWTTWCPPCRADGPALDKLYSKYGQKDLMIVGISVSEDRPVMEKFLKDHPHTYPIVLTTENEMPRPYQIRVFPTYIVIDRDGTVAAAVEGDRGFGDLRHLLKKAGLEAE